MQSRGLANCSVAEMSRLLALDPGTKRIGVAVSNSARSLAFPRECFQREGDWQRALVQLIEEEGVDEVIVGRPVALSGRETSSTTMSEEFIAEVAALLPELRVSSVDERLTTTSASRQMAMAGRSQKSQRRDIDSAAAVVLLQGVLDAQA